MKKEAHTIKKQPHNQKLEELFFWKIGFAIFATRGF